MPELPPDPARLYPPRVVAPDIALAASPAYRRRVVRLVFGLLGFALTYLYLLVGCVAAPIVLIAAAIQQPLHWISAGLALPLFGAMVFVLVRGLLGRPGDGEPSIEVTPAEQPRLFGFIQRLATDAGAKIPDRVCVSPGVNAAMQGSTSAIGLVFGGPRELVIGLGLVNAVDVRELEAVLAHELGHFAQSSARLGQWAHRTTVVLRAVVLGRGRFDERLARARSSPSWFKRALAWLPVLGIAGIRGLLTKLLARITRSSLALARELEFNADLHAVRLCGSDPLVAALWRAQRGALAMSSTLAALRELGKHGAFSDDLYAHQDARADELDDRLAHSGDPMILALRRPYRYGPNLHFPAGEAPAEIMSYSHPSYAAREHNAKATYVAVPEQRWPSAWALFDDHAQLRRRATAAEYERLGFAEAHDPARMRSAAEIERRIADEIAEREQGRQYFGFYDNRVIEFGDVELLIRQARDASEVEHARFELAVARWRGVELERFMAAWRATDAALDRLRTREARADPEHAELLRLAKLERERQRIEAREGDQAVFCWLWRRADQAARDELERRVRFLAFVQDQIVALNHHRGLVLPLFSKPDALAELDEALARLHADVDTLLRAAEAIPLPELRNLEDRRSTREVLLAEPLAGPHDGTQAMRVWLGEFMPQVTRVHDRLRTLHYKNLGRLLALREQIEADLSGRAGSPASADDRRES